MAAAGNNVVGAAAARVVVDAGAAALRAGRIGGRGLRAGLRLCSAPQLQAAGGAGEGGEGHRGRHRQLWHGGRGRHVHAELDRHHHRAQQCKYPASSLPCTAVTVQCSATGSCC